MVPDKSVTLMCGLMIFLLRQCGWFIFLVVCWQTSASFTMYILSLPIYYLFESSGGFKYV
jgi:hypothetical protein